VDYGDSSPQDHRRRAAGACWVIPAIERQGGAWARCPGERARSRADQRAASAMALGGTIGLFGDACWSVLRETPAPPATGWRGRSPPVYFQEENTCTPLAFLLAERDHWNWGTVWGLIHAGGDRTGLAEFSRGISPSDFRCAAFFIATGAGAVHATGAEAGWHRCGQFPFSRQPRLRRLAVRRRKHRHRGRAWR
jgi:hypothetical protein